MKDLPRARLRADGAEVVPVVGLLAPEGAPAPLLGEVRVPPDRRGFLRMQQEAADLAKWEASLPKTGQPVLFDGHPATVLAMQSKNQQARDATFRLRVTMPAGYSEVTAFLNEIQVLTEKPR